MAARLYKPDNASTGANAQFRENNTVSWDANGITFTRRLLIVEMTGSDETKLLQALSAAGVPKYGELLTTYTASNLYVTSVVPSLCEASTSQAFVDVTYKTRQYIGAGIPEGQVPSETGETAQGWGASLVSVEASRDPAGLPWVLRYTTIAGNQLPGQPFKATIQEPVFTFYAQRPEPINYTREKIKNNVGKVNSSPWNTLLARQWLCTAIKADLKSGGVTNGPFVLLRYEFIGRTRGWDPKGVYADPITKAPFIDSIILPVPPVPVPVNAVAPEETFKYYEEADFSQLSLLGPNL